MHNSWCWQALLHLNYVGWQTIPLLTLPLGNLWWWFGYFLTCLASKLFCTKKCQAFPNSAWDMIVSVLLGFNIADPWRWYICLAFSLPVFSCTDPVGDYSYRLSYWDPAARGELVSILCHRVGVQNTLSWYDVTIPNTLLHHWGSNNLSHLYSVATRPTDGTKQPSNKDRMSSPTDAGQWQASTLTTASLEECLVNPSPRLHQLIWYLDNNKHINFINTLQSGWTTRAHTPLRAHNSNKKKSTNTTYRTKVFCFAHAGSSQTCSVDPHG